MEYALNKSRFSFKVKPLDYTSKRYKLIISLLITLSVVMIVVSASTDGVIITKFKQFDDMHAYYTSMDKPLVDDVMKSVNTVVFNLVEFVGQFIGSMLILLATVSAGFAVWFAAKPEFAEKVSEVKQRVASGEKIPLDDIESFLLQFCPDIKANSGLATEYEYERPTLGLFVRDHLYLYIILFAVAIMIQQNILITFIVKSANAVAYAGKYYTESTDFIGMVNSVTTAGKDYKPGYDTMTTEGKNKKKTFNAIYSAVKREYPRYRTEEFLQKVGIATHTTILDLESNSAINFSAQNFSASAEVVITKIEPDESTVNFRYNTDLSNFVNLMPGESDKVVHLNVIQYDILDRENSSTGIPSAYDYTNGWVYGGGSYYPTALDIGKQYEGQLSLPNNPYRFEAPSDAPEVQVVVRFAGSNTVVKGAVKGNISTTGYTISLEGLRSQIEAVTDARVSSISITGIAKGVKLKTQQDPKQTQEIKPTAEWKKQN